MSKPASDSRNDTPKQRPPACDTPLSVAITPTLFIGRYDNGFDDALFVITVEDALTVLKSGHIAVFPPPGWEEARRTLTALQVPPDDIDRKIAYAQSGLPGRKALLACRERPAERM